MAENARTPVGSQTLARGIRALLAIVDSRDGMTAQELAAELDVHRTIAYRVLQTWSSFGFVTQGSGVYRAGPRLATLADAYLPAFREVALPAMRDLADQTCCTVSLFVAERNEAVSITLVEPTTTSHFHLRFKAGMRTPLDRGAAGYALLAADPPIDGEPEGVTRARQQGFATSHGEIEGGAYGVAAHIPDSHPAACVNLITYNEDLARNAETHIVKAARTVGEALRHA